MYFAFTGPFCGCQHSLTLSWEERKGARAEAIPELQDFEMTALNRSL